MATVQPGGVRETLGVREAMAITVGIVVGAGIFRTPSLVAGAADGAASVLLEVRVDNAPALHLYEALGFERLGRRRGYYQPENVDAWTMRLPLGAAASDVPSA